MGQDTDELKRDIERTRKELGGTLDAIGDRVSPGRIMERRKNSIRNSISTARERVMGTGHEGTDSTTVSSHDTGSAVHDAAGSAVDSVRHAPESLKVRTEGSPITAGALAFGVGFLAAAAFPSSRKEREMGPAVLERLEPLKQELAGAASTIAEDMRQPVHEAASGLAARARTSVDEITDTAKHIND